MGKFICSAINNVLDFPVFQGPVTACIDSPWIHPCIWLHLCLPHSSFGPLFPAAGNLNISYVIKYDYLHVSIIVTFTILSIENSKSQWAKGGGGSCRINLDTWFWDNSWINRSIQLLSPRFCCPHGGHAHFFTKMNQKK